MLDDIERTRRRWVGARLFPAESLRGSYSKQPVSSCGSGENSQVLDDLTNQLLISIPHWSRKTMTIVHIRPTSCSHYASPSMVDNILARAHRTLLVKRGSSISGQMMRLVEGCLEGGEAAQDGLIHGVKPSINASLWKSNVNTIGLSASPH
jgi:hypothetical protein